ncbi:reverse transcriptase domain-containing protein [Tanacetum coccineum]
MTSEEGLDKCYERMQKMLTQMNSLKIKPEQEEVNMCFLRALPESWRQVSLSLRARGGLDLLTFEDLYSKLKFLESDVVFMYDESDSEDDVSTEECVPAEVVISADDVVDSAEAVDSADCVVVSADCSVSAGGAQISDQPLAFVGEVQAPFLMIPLYSAEIPNSADTLLLAVELDMILAKGLIEVDKIPTERNVADLLTKKFDGPRFSFLVVNIGASIHSGLCLRGGLTGVEGRLAVFIERGYPIGVQLLFAGLKKEDVYQKEGHLQYASDEDVPSLDLSQAVGSDLAHWEVLSTDFGLGEIHLVRWADGSERRFTTPASGLGLDLWGSLRNLIAARLATPELMATGKETSKSITCGSNLLLSKGLCLALSLVADLDTLLYVLHFELKDLPPHLEYAFLEGNDKLPVIIAKDLSVEEKAALIKVLKSHKRAIAWKLSDIKGINLEFCTHKILMEEDYKPAVQHQRRVNPKIHDVIKKEVEKLLDAGLIYPISDSPWVSPVHCVPKKGGFTVVENDENELIPTRLVTGWRVCIDYQKLNEATRKDHFPLPFMDQMLERLAGNEYYCFLDGFSGYFQIPIDPHDQEKTTFTCPYGTFAYRRMPFGLCNAPGTFQRCMMAIFHDMIKKTMEVFMDDFSVFGNSFGNCLSRVDKMLQRCEDTNLCLNWEKSHFMVKEGIVLGHKISKNGIEVDKAKIDVIAKLPHPTTVKGVRSFLGHAGFLTDLH